MIQVSDLSKHFGGQTLFEGVSLQLFPPYRYGIVGANGSGKSTFLRILMGEEHASGGEVTMPKRARIGVLRQDRFESLEQPVIEVAMMGDLELWEAMAERDRLLQAAGAGKELDGDRYAALEDLVVQRDGYTLEARAGEILEGLGIPTKMHKGPLRALSGGFQLRALLAQTLAARPDALLLDEPTNHLDIVSIKWLEQFLISYTGLTAVVSHDHNFLDTVCTHILDVDYGVITLYPGNYSDFEEEKAEARARKEKEIAKREKKISEAKQFIDRFKAKATKARQAQSRVKQIAKIEIEPLADTSRRYPHFAFRQTRPPGKEVLDVKAVEKSYGEARVLGGIDLQVRRGERVAIIGANGVGKSTLLKILVGVLGADGGSAAWGHEVQVGYFPQDHKDALGSEGTVLSWLWDQVPGETVGVVRGSLGRVLFEGDAVDKRLRDLSGGEAARLLFCGLMVTHPNVLVLDEPTNHLDMEAIEALAAALSEYDGTLLFVSHDRWLVGQLATRIVEVRPDGVNDFMGTYAEYLARAGEDHLDAEAVLQRQREAKSETVAAGRDARSEREERKAKDRARKKLEGERDRALAELEAAEAEKKGIDDRFCAPGYFESTRPDEIQRDQARQAELDERIGVLMARWEELEGELGALD